MKVALSLSLLLACVTGASAAPETPERGQAHHQSFACPLRGCKVTCVAAAKAPALEFTAGALALTLLPSRVGVFEARNGVSGKKTYLVDLNERNCEIDE